MRRSRAPKENFSIDVYTHVTSHVHIYKHTCIYIYIYIYIYVYTRTYVRTSVHRLWLLRCYIRWAWGDGGPPNHNGPPPPKPRMILGPRRTFWYKCFDKNNQLLKMRKRNLYHYISKAAAQHSKAELSSKHILHLFVSI